MKRSKKLALLLGVLVVLCAATFAAQQLERRQETIRTSGEIILAVPADTVEALHWEYGDTALSFHREDTWLYDDDADFPVDEDKMQELLAVFESFGVSFVIEDVSDLSLYGLDKPECTIELTADGETHSIALGDYSRMDEERYVSIGDGNVYLAKVDPLDSFAVTRDDLFLHDSSLSYEQIERITFAGTENYTIYREENSDNARHADDLYYTERNGEVVPLDTDRVGNYVGVLSALSLSDYVTYSATEEALTACGLLDPELRITVEYTDWDGAAQTYVLSVSRDSEELAAAEEAERNGEEADSVSAYVRVGDSQIIYRVSEYYSNELLAASFDALRHREVLDADFSDISQLDLTLEGNDYTLSSDEEDGERVWRFGEMEIDISDLQDALEGLLVEYSADFTTAQPSGKEELSLTAHLTDDRRTTVRIGLFRHDGEYCTAVVDGEPLALVPRSEVVTLIEAVNSIVLNEPA